MLTWGATCRRTFPLQGRGILIIGIPTLRGDIDAMTKSGRMVAVCVSLVGVLVNFPAQAGATCFASSKSYRIHPLRNGSDIRDGWTVKSDAFSECVHRAETADKSLHAKYPDSVYALSLMATIGCHSPC